MAEANLKKLFKELPKSFNPAAMPADKTKATINFDLEGQPHHVVIDGSDCTVNPGLVDGGADVTLQMKTKDFVSLVTDGMRGMVPLLTGKMKVSGDLALAIRLQSIFKT